MLDVSKTSSSIFKFLHSAPISASSVWWTAQILEEEEGEGGVRKEERKRKRGERKGK